MTNTYNKNTLFSTYRDDWTESDGYYTILFNNGRKLQSRELTQLQTILQNQIKRFGDNIFKEGAAVNPGSIVVDNRYEFIKLASGTSLPSDTSVLVGQTFVGQSSGVEAVVLEVVASTSTDPVTLYVRYSDTSSGTAGATTVRMTPGESITDGSYTFTVQNTNTSSNPAIGVGTKASVGKGNFYALGYFVFTEKQTIIVSKYNGFGTANIGFKVTEDVVTENDNSALYDNSTQNPNTTAPGAHRHRILLTLVNEADVDSDEIFIYVGRISNGELIHDVKAIDDYNVINDLLALRTKEESGNYVAEKIFLNMIDNDSDTSKLTAKVSTGVVYVNGYRSAVNYPIKKELSKPRTTEQIANQAISVDYGNYVKSDAGAGLRNIQNFETVNLKDSSGYTGTTIGTGRICAFDNEPTLANGVRFYFLDINMNSGQSFRNVKSFGTTDSDYSNIYQEAGKSVLYGTDKASLLFELPRDRPQSMVDTSVTVQRYFSTTTDSSGNATINVSATGETFTNTSDWIFANADSAYETGLSVSGGGTQAATISGGPLNSTNFEIYAYVNKANATHKVKTLTETTVAAAVESDGAGLIYVPLGVADIYSVSRVRAVDSDGIDLSNKFRLDNGQRDTFYGLGRMVLNGGNSAPSGNVFVRFKYFTHSSSGDYFSVNSYSGQVDYADIQNYTLNNGDTVNLRDMLDFRPVKNASDTFNGGVARVMNLPEPSTTVTSDITYYLPRIDVLSINENNTLIFHTGTPAFEPVAPTIPNQELALYLIEYNPYTLDRNDLELTRYKYKRYTMADIGRLEERIENIEEVVSLSLLELDTLNLDVLDSAGNNRLKSGFIVDNFDDFFLSDYDNNEYRAALDLQVNTMGPEVNLNSIRLIYDSDNSSNTILKGDNVYMKYNTTSYISQDKVSGTLSINPYEVQSYAGTVVLTPTSDYWFDEEKLADEVLVKTIKKKSKKLSNYSNPALYNDYSGAGIAGGK